MIDEDLQSAIHWSEQKREFVHDGTHRDIYVLGTGLPDWSVILDLIFKRYAPRLTKHGVPAELPSDLASLFAYDNGYQLVFLVGNIEVDCHFFTQDQIELTFAPDGVTEAELLKLLELMRAIGDTSQKDVLMTPENLLDAPLFRYSARAREMQWIPYRRP